jgi:hypothetical protein
MKKEVEPPSMTSGSLVTMAIHQLDFSMSSTSSRTRKLLLNSVLIVYKLQLRIDFLFASRRRASSLTVVRTGLHCSAG